MNDCLLFNAQYFSYIHDERKRLQIINIISNNVALEGIFRLPQETRGYNGKGRKHLICKWLQTTTFHMLLLISSFVNLLHARTMTSHTKSSKWCVHNGCTTQRRYWNYFYNFGFLPWSYNIKKPCTKSNTWPRKYSTESNTDIYKKISI